MKQKDDQESTTVKRIPWDADSSTPDGPSSLNVLLMWMLTPGKYERVHGDQRSKAIRNILIALRKNGIEHRSESSIRSKLHSIENQYLSAKQWLEESGINGADVADGRVDSDTKAAVLSICPHYWELMPVLCHSSFLNEVSIGQTEAVNGGQDEATDSEDKAKVARSKEKRKAKKEAQHPSKRHKKTTTEIEPRPDVHENEDEDHAPVARVLNCVRRTTSYGELHGNELDLSGAQNWFQRTDHCELVIRDSDAQVPPEVQRELAEVKLNHVKKQSQAVLENEDKLRTEVTKCDVEVKRGRGQLQLLLEKMMVRQAMKKGDVPKEEIECVLPLKES